MTCINCQTRIQNALTKHPGITQAAVSYETETADILYDSSVISLEQIQGLIDELGYSASVQKASCAKIVSQTLRELGIIVILYFLLRHFGILNYLAPASLADAQMGYGMLFVIGLITSVHCIAMCGGINLSQCLPRETAVFSGSVQPVPCLSLYWGLPWRHSAGDQEHAFCTAVSCHYRTERCAGPLDY